MQHSTPLSDPPCASFAFEGKSFKIYGVHEGDHIFSQISHHKRFYEGDFLKYFRFMVRQKGEILDIGANIGNHSIFFSKVMGRQVSAFEPNDIAYQLLVKNIEENSASVKPFKIGLSNQSGTTDFIDNPKTEQNFGAASLKHETTEDSGAVKLHTLDEFLKAINLQARISALKIDVEGFEYRVIQGALGTLATHQPSVFVELKDDHALSQTHPLLLNAGYCPIHVMGFTPMWHYVPKSRMRYELIRSRSWILARRAWARARAITRSAGAKS